MIKKALNRRFKAFFDHISTSHVLNHFTGLVSTVYLSIYTHHDLEFNHDLCIARNPELKMLTLGRFAFERFLLTFHNYINVR